MLTRGDLDLLKDFSRNTGVKVQEAHHVLTKMIAKIEQVNMKNDPSLRLSWREEAGHWAVIAIQVICIDDYCQHRLTPFIDHRLCGISHCDSVGWLPSSGVLVSPCKNASVSLSDRQFTLDLVSFILGESCVIV
jgi:hypothetical protein